MIIVMVVVFSDRHTFMFVAFKAQEFSQYLSTAVVIIQKKKKKSPPKKLKRVVGIRGKKKTVLTWAGYVGHQIEG